MDVSPITGNAVAAGTGDSLAQLVAGMQQDSLFFSRLDERGVVDKLMVNNTPTLVGNDPHLNIFNLTETQASIWQGNYNSRKIIAPPGSTVLVNVPGTAITYSPGTLDVEGASPNTVLLNYYEAETFSGDHFTHNGSILAPFTTLVEMGLAEGALSINGSATFGGEVTQRFGSEFHNYPFQGLIIPEPSAYAWTAGAGLLILVLGRRRRKWRATHA
jgi:choice-of-anchor A domain-containing protein